MTFQRLVQSSIEDIAYAQRIARLRAFYLGLAPELEPFLLMVHGPRAEGLSHDKRLGPSAWQLMLTTAGMVGVVNSAVIGACAGLAIQTLPIGSFAPSSSWPDQSPGSRRWCSIAATTGEHATPIAQRASTGPRSSSQ